jgi:phage gp29-like protein
MDTQSALRQQVMRDVQNSTDPALGTGAPPNWGRKPVPHIMSFSGLAASVARVYRNADEAYRNSIQNARFMRSDIGIMECLESRQRCTSELPWHIEPEDAKSQDQKELCAHLEDLISRTRKFSEMRRCLMEAIWYGRSGIQLQWRRQQIYGKGTYTLPMALPKEESFGWWPIHGDKLAFRYDDEKPIFGLYGEPLGAIGVRVSSAMVDSRLRPYIHQTDRHMAYFYPEWQREMLIVHKHQIEDGDYEDPISAGSVNGVGLRSRVYWEWFQKQELLAMLMEYLERSAAGIEIWEYPAGNATAKAAVEEQARERRGSSQSAILFPKPMGEDASQYDVRHVEPGMAGAQAIQDLLTEYYGKRIKRLILGQNLTSEADSTGMGSGVADAHRKTLSQIVSYDAGNLEETLTHELLKPFVKFNCPHAVHMNLKFRIDTEDPDTESRLEGFRTAFDLGARLKESDVLDAIGASPPNDDDVVLQNQQAGQPPEQPGGDPFEGDPSEPAEPEEVADHLNQALQVHADAAPGDGASLMGSGADDNPPGRERYNLASDAAKQTDRRPTDPQKTAGNYAKGKFSIRGLQISIENPRGATRSGTDAEGKPWSVRMPCHYGYFRRTEGNDGDQVDVFVGGREQSELAFVVDQVDAKGKFDEHKVLIGFDNQADALEAYRGAYNTDWKGLQAITAFTWPQLRAWLANSDLTKPVG